MDETRRLLADTADRLFSDLVTRELIVEAEKGAFPTDLWNTVEENGLTRILVPEAQGGVGAGWGEAAVVLRASGSHCAPLPIAETLVAGALLSAAGLDVPDGPITIAEGEVALDGSTAGGTLTGVPWARHAGHVVCALTAGNAFDIACIALEGAEIAPDVNLALEPRDTVKLGSAPAVVGRAELPADPARHFGALARSLQMAGALARLLDEGVTYANDRTQFGRPIGKFQAIQHQLSVLATQVAAAGLAADLAAARTDTGDAIFEIAVAKARAGEAAGLATSIAHQVHGAIGFTYEHSLHFATRRLWAWRSEYGSAAHWQRRLGETVLEQDADELWAMVTAH